MFLDQLTDGLGGPSALAQPMLDAVALQDHLSSLGSGVESADDLDKGTIAGGLGVGNDDSVEGFLFGAMAGHANFHGHKLPFKIKRGGRFSLIPR